MLPVQPEALQRFASSEVWMICVSCHPMHRNKPFRRLIASSCALTRMGRKEQIGYASKRQIVVFGLVVVALLVGLYGARRYFQSERERWPSAQVPLSEVRTRLVQVLESQRGTHVVYQAEAHVSYIVEGKQHRLWLPILSRSDSQQTLQFELRELRNASCYVHWDQEQPDHAFLTCDRKTPLP